ncbi:MAG: N-acetylornithine carbamoyltransferase [Bacteroidota bacterium]
MPSLSSWLDAPPAAWTRCLDRALVHHERRRWSQAAHGKALGLLFFASSLRTRTSMDLAAAHLGAHAVTLNPGQGVWGFEWRDRDPDGQPITMDRDAAEHIREAVGVLSRYVDALGVRVFATLSDRDADQADTLFRRIAEVATVPVVNLESARWHPCQELGDAATIRTHFAGQGAERSTLPQGHRFVLAWAPHPKPLPRAVPNSALLMAARLGMHVTVARPDGFGLDADVLDAARATAATAGGSIAETSDLDAALAADGGAHVVYAKAWHGDAVYAAPDDEAALRAQHANWKLTADRMQRTADGIFMHCLPVRRGVVVDGAVLDGPQARHLLQAEFRLHAQKAILEWAWDLLGPDVLV